VYKPPRAIAIKRRRIIIGEVSRESKLILISSYTKCALRYLIG
jgi:hypothetical protein